MQVTLEAIKFNHEPGSATTDAFGIRKNETESVTVPEWQGCTGVDCKNFPAAYARDGITGPIVIKAKFTCADLDVTSIKVQALDGHVQDDTSPPDASLTNVLGVVMQKDVALANGESEFIPFTLDRVRICGAGVSVSEVIWQWQFCADSQNCEDPQNWTDFARTSHEIYTVLALPKDPWKPLSIDPTETQLPWTDVLDVTLDWAGGAQDLDEAATRITRKLNELGSSKFKYDEAGSGSSHFIYPRTANFKCASFLEHVQSPDGERKYVNCSDCSTVVSSFSNILGGDLWQSQMGFDFLTNPIIKIGSQAQRRVPFSYHEVAWKNGCGKADALFDACLQVDGDSDPTSKVQFTPLVGVNVRLGDPTGQDYHFRLAQHNSDGARCEAQPGTKVRRSIGANRVVLRSIHPVLMDILSKRHDFPGWENTRTSEQHVLLWRYSPFSPRFLPKGWQLSRVEELHGGPETFDLKDSFWRPLGEPFDAELQAVIYECSSLRAAHSFLSELLAEFQLTTIERQEDFIIDYDRVAIGDVSFAGPKDRDEGYLAPRDLTVLFARANLVVLLRNVKSSLTPASQLASEIDRDLISNPETTGEKIEEVERFSFPDGKFQVGDEVPIRILNLSLEDAEPSYKFLSSSGEVFFRKGKLLYRPSSAGIQHVTVFEFRTGKNTSRQSLSLNVESTPIDSNRE